MSKITAALSAAGRCEAAVRAAQIQQLLRAPRLRQPGPVQAAYAAIVTAQVALNTQIEELDEVVAAHLGQHPDSEIYTSHPGLGVILGAQVLAEFSD